MTTPRSLGYHMPAEWESHAATWLSWPHNESSWPGKFEAVQPAYAAMVAALAQSEPVHINVNSIDMERLAQKHLDAAGARGQIHFHCFPTNDAWCRDHGPICVVNDAAPADHQLAAVDWKFNAWGGKYPCELDDQIAARITDELNAIPFQTDVVMEGGSIDVNGRGLLLTTEACLLNRNRNPHLTQQEIEEALSSFLSVDEVIWLGDGIAGDDTDGHVDDLTRFVGPDTVVTAVETDQQDQNFGPLNDNLMRLRAWRSRSGASLEVLPLPMPPPMIRNGQRLPASYANFYIANKMVLLPGYHQATDEIAAAALQEVFPDRHVVTVDCTQIIWGLGACHCLTQQIPARPAHPLTD